MSVAPCVTTRSPGFRPEVTGHRGAIQRHRRDHPWRKALGRSLTQTMVWLAGLRSSAAAGTCTPSTLSVDCTNTRTGWPSGQGAQRGRVARKPQRLRLIAQAAPRPESAAARAARPRPAWHRPRLGLCRVVSQGLDAQTRWVYHLEHQFARIHHLPGHGIGRGNDARHRGHQRIASGQARAHGPRRWVRLCQLALGGFDVLCAARCRPARSSGAPR